MKNYQGIDECTAFRYRLGVCHTLSVCAGKITRADLEGTSDRGETNPCIFGDNGITGSGVVDSAACIADRFVDDPRVIFERGEFPPRGDLGLIVRGDFTS